MKITVERDDGQTVDITEGVQFLYDRLESTMDFGSGFMDHEELTAMRKVAYACGFKMLTNSMDLCVCGHVRERHIRFLGDSKACSAGWRSAYSRASQPPRSWDRISIKDSCECTGFVLQED